MSDEKIAAAGVQRDPSAVVPDELALLPLRDTVLFPQSILPLAAGRPSSLNLIEDAVRGGHLIGVFTQRDPATEEPQGADLYRIGTLAALNRRVRLELLETTGVKARLARLVSALTKEAEVLELGSKIQSQVESEVGKSQRDFYLREQLKAIQKELGQTDDRAQELGELRQKIEAAGMTEE